MRLRVAMRISGTWPGIAQEAAKAAVTHKAGLIESNSDNAMLSCGTQSNPYQLAAVSWGDLRVNANIVDYMNAYGDPRMPKFFNKSTLAGKTDKYVGMRTGDADFKKADAAGFSIPAYTATSKLMVFCAAETAFYVQKENCVVGMSVLKQQKPITKMVLICQWNNIRFQPLNT